ncbi:hypothetical protein N7535_004372 [Penicillium sp. DV-2018c]|nr:hypothetical protein N7535_004372 [Penicillium sp. DV-2018c]
MSLEPDMFDMDDVIAKTKDLQIIELATKTHEVALPGIAEKVKVSDSVKVVGSGITTKGSEFLVKTGSELTNDFSINANAHANSLFGLTAIRQDHFHADIIIPGNEGGRLEILSKEFLQAVDCLKPWKETDDIKKAYLDFFKTWGTHVILRCYYGSRFALQVEWENAMSRNKESYKANLKAEFGTNFGGKVDVAEDAFHKEYRQQRMKNLV